MNPRNPTHIAVIVEPATISIGKSDLARPSSRVGRARVPLLPDNDVRQAAHDVLARYSEQELLQDVDGLVGV